MAESHHANAPLVLRTLTYRAGGTAWKTAWRAILNLRGLERKWFRSRTPDSLRGASLCPSLISILACPPRQGILAIT